MNVGKYPTDCLSYKVRKEEIEMPQLCIKLTKAFQSPKAKELNNLDSEMSSEDIKQIFQASKSSTSRALD